MCKINPPIFNITPFEETCEEPGKGPESLTSNQVQQSHGLPLDSCFDLLLSHVLVYSEKYCSFDTVHTFKAYCSQRRKGEGAECSVTVIARV